MHCVDDLTGLKTTSEILIVLAEANRGIATCFKTVSNFEILTRLLITFISIQAEANVGWL